MFFQPDVYSVRFSLVDPRFSLVMLSLVNHRPPVHATTARQTSAHSVPLYPLFSPLFLLGSNPKLVSFCKPCVHRPPHTVLLSVLFFLRLANQVSRPNCPLARVSLSPVFSDLVRAPDSRTQKKPPQKNPTHPQSNLPFRVAHVFLQGKSPPSFFFCLANCG